MNPQPSLKTVLLQQLSRGKGQLKTWAIGAAATALTAFLTARTDWNITEENKQLVVLHASGFVGMAVVGIINTIVAYFTTDGAAEIQKDLRRVDPTIQVDGVPGPNTQAVTKELVQTVQDANTGANLLAR